MGLEKQFPFAVRFMNVFSKVEHLHTQVQKQIFAESAALPPSLNLRGGNLTLIWFFFLTSPGHIVQIKPSTGVPESKTCLRGEMPRVFNLQWDLKANVFCAGLDFVESV